MPLARWQATIVDEAGNVLPGAQVTVRREVAGAPLALLFADRDGLVPIGNPFLTDGGGFAFFHAAGGAYRITAMLGSSTRSWRYVGIGTLAEQDSDNPSFYNETLTGYLDLTEIAEPASPAVNVARLTAIDDGTGITTFGMKDGAGNVVPMSHFKQSGTGAVTRTQEAKLREVVSVTDFGAIADGASHPLSERFASLGAAQAVYPHATALTDEIDWAAIQAGLDILEVAGGGRLVLPASTSIYAVNKPLVYESLKPISLYGLGSTAGRAANMRVAIQYTGVAASNALEFRTPGVGHLNGVEIKNLTIFRGTAQAQGDGGRGLMLKGVRPFIIENVTISGFDTGWGTDEVAGIRCGYGHVSS